ncbi:hypothetical protein Aspvir_002525 [Aspergillus viridinutans]|uniref:Zn(2)-C6 fungal-type domain-containing protein n=1 Tax=Aspergillus viridinutans TaxID=75553 RepID=A0A9P3C627_ASPVI|nr:uncharacterized protein Aspvir_002525 [Aspergillus viridinutans]GIK06873.1 hypothetical protein Aspvir_002525 [Aspergillus viridinutans]
MSSYAPSTMAYPAAASMTALSIPVVDDPAEDSKSKSYRRSRSGCYTCRVRRKKCDETRPSCQACTKLGLKCDYKPPLWWISVDQRRVQKERIKDRIRQTKTMEKHGSLQEYMERIRELSQKPATVAVEYDFNRPLWVEQYNPLTTSLMTPVVPYEFDIRTNHETFLNNAPLTNNASLSAFGSLIPQQPYSTIPELPSEVCFPSYATRTPNYSPVSPAGLVFPDRPLSSYLQTTVPLDDNDRSLLNHFLDNVLRLVFPIVEAHQQTFLVRAREILNYLQNNRSYLHCCLSVSAIHLKTSRGLTDEMDHDIMRHRYEAISQLCRALSDGPSHEHVLDATLAMIFYHCSVGEPDDYLPDIPWNTHFKAVSNLVNKPTSAPTQFSVSIITWIDILGATMMGQTPHFAHTYRTKHLSGIASGLQQVMGCDDRIMYLISEIACLESLKIEGRVDDMAVCQHVSALSAQLDWTEPAERTLDVPYSPSGVVQPDQLTKVVTALFRTAARIYLYSLMPGFGLYDPNNIILVAAVGEILQCLPAGALGFDRSLVWPLFIAGAHSVPYSGFRKILTDRIAALGYLGNFGSIGRMYRVLQELWKLSNDPLTSPSASTGSRNSGQNGASSELQPSEQQIHWRELMKRKKWDYLLI